MKYLITTILAILLLITYKPQEAKAQTITLGVWPPILQIMIQPGKSITQVYKVDNQGDPVIISSSITPFVPSDNYGNISLIECSKLQVLGCESLSWLSFQNADLDLGESFFLGSGRVQEVVLKISVPPYAAEGDYYNTLLFTTQAPPGLGSTKTRATATVGSNILITVSQDGNPTRTTTVSEFKSQKTISILGFRFTLPLFDSFEEIPVSLKVNNQGNAYTNLQGSIILSGFPGLRSNYTVPPTNVLGGTGRILFATPSAQIVSLTGKGTIPSLVLGKGFYIGRYKLNVDLEAVGNNNIKAQTYFYALPYKIIGVLFGLTICLLIIRKYVSKK